MKRSMMILAILAASMKGQVAWADAVSDLTYRLQAAESNYNNQRRSLIGQLNSLEGSAQAVAAEFNQANQHLQQPNLSPAQHNFWIGKRNALQQRHASLQTAINQKTGVINNLDSAHQNTINQLNAQLEIAQQQKIQDIQQQTGTGGVVIQGNIVVNGGGAPPEPQDQFSPTLGAYYVPVPQGDGTFGLRLTRNAIATSPLAGFETGDIILALDGMAIRSPADVENHSDNTTVDVINVRNGAREQVNVFIQK